MLISSSFIPYIDSMPKNMFFLNASSVSISVNVSAWHLVQILFVDLRVRLLSVLKWQPLMVTAL
jgi:hypothetical protein